MRGDTGFRVGGEEYTCKLRRRSLRTYPHPQRPEPSHDPLPHDPFTRLALAC
jgi:hypothetical protein